MAKLQIDVEVLNKVAQQHQELKQKGGYTSAVKFERADALVQQLLELTKKMPTTTEGIKGFISSFRELLNIIGDAAAQVDKLSDSTKLLTKKINQDEKIYNKLLSKASKKADYGKQYDSNGNYISMIGKAMETGVFDKNTAQITNAHLSRELTKIYKVHRKDGKEITDYKDFLKQRQAGNIHKDDVAKIPEIIKKFGDSNTIGTYVQEWRDGLDKIYQRILLIKKVLSKRQEQFNLAAGSAPETKKVGWTKNELEKWNKAWRDQLDEEKGAAQATDALTQKIQKQQTTLGKAFKQFTIYTVVIRAVKRAATEAVRTIGELDKSLTEQAMVTGLTRQETYKLIGTYQELALETGATTKEVAEVASEYMKQGHTVADSITLTKAAVSAAKVARVSVGDSINYLTTALNGFQLSAEDAMRVSDKFAAVAAASATDYDELAIALSKVASQANLAGMSIDYTTALLTKGLETTREAPETMGTALKTIIARMREMADYGRTLDDSMDVNNVESQLAYVGIKLRDTNGELRSTQDVLDDLGNKWQTLNTNQQAALAKALAGTRQQSRLIALMDGYERVTELQQISLDSAGATAAQADVYLQGIEASLNKINVAWEKIITGLTNSDFITWLFDQVAATLENVNAIVNNTAGQIALFTGIGVALAGIIAQKIIETNLAKKQLLLANQELIVKNKDVIAEKEKEKSLRRQLLLKQNAGKTIKGYKIGLSGGITDKNGKSIKNTKNNKKKDRVLDDIFGPDEADSIISQLEHQNLLLGKNKGIGLFRGAFEILNEHLDGAATGLKKIVDKVPGINKLKTKLAAIPGIGIKISIALGIAGAAITGIVLLTHRFSNSIDDTAKRVKKLSNEIFTLNKKNTELTNLTDKFQIIEKQVIKTNKDLEEQKKLLESAKDLLNDEEKIEYENLATNKAKYEYLTKIQDKRQQSLKTLREERIKELNRLNKQDLNKVLTGTDETSLMFKDTILSEASMQFTEISNKIENISTKERIALKEIGRQILDNADSLELYNLIQNEGMEHFLSDLQRVERIKTKNGENNTVYSILSSDDFTIKEKTEAYKAVMAELEGESKKAFSTAFNDIGDIVALGDDVVDLIDHFNLSSNDLNNIASIWEKLQKSGMNIGEDEYKDLLFKKFLPTLAENNNNLKQTVDIVFGSYLEQFENDTEKWNEVYNTFIDSYGKLVAKSTLDISQSTEKFSKTIENFYKIADQWDTMKDSERASFIEDNADLFKGEGGEDLLTAFETGNYQRIEEALKTNEGLMNRLEKIREEIDQALEVEMARVGADRNEARIKFLQDKKEMYKDINSLVKVSLKAELEQESKQLKEYKNYLQKQKEELTKSLEEKKKSYEKYFDDINKAEKLQENDEARNQVERNMMTISSSSDSATMQQFLEMQEELKELDKEALKESREQAREALLNNLDDSIDQINTKFDKLLDNERKLLEAMKIDMKSPQAFINKLINNAAKEGKTHLQLQDFMETLKNTFSSSLNKDVKWDQSMIDNAISNSNNMYFNVNNKNYELSNNEQESFLKLFMEIMTRIGGM